jgi:hypothetical protein
MMFNIQLVLLFSEVQQLIKNSQPGWRKAGVIRSAAAK